MGQRRVSPAVDWGVGGGSWAISYLLLPGSGKGEDLEEEWATKKKVSE